MRDRILVCVALWAVAAHGQTATTVTTGGQDAPYQIRYAANLLIGDSVVNLTNSGASSTVGYPIQNGNICANVYTYSPDEQLVSCCSCYVTPNGLMSLSAKQDLISNTLTPLIPSSIVIKVLSTKGTSTSTCNASTAGQPGGNDIVPGLAAWGTTIHLLPAVGTTGTGTYGVTESAFTPATLSSAELYRMTALCGFIQANGSGYGICKSCRSGGLGAAKKD
jgi:hypothetical protein